MSSDVNNTGLNYHIELIIDGISIPSHNVIFCNIKESIFNRLVTLEMILMDPGHLLDISPIEDETTVTIKLGKSSKINIIDMEFVVKGFTQEMSHSDRGRSTQFVNIVAIQKNDVMHPIKTRAMFGSSSSVVSELVSKSFKYEKRVDSNDSQNWLQINMSNYDMLYHIQPISHVAFNDTVLMYPNRHNSFIYTSLQTQAKRDSKVDFVFDTEKAIADEREPDVDTLLEEKESKKKRFYYDKWSIKSIQPIINELTSYGLQCTYYDFSKMITFNLTNKTSPLTTNQHRKKSNVGKFVDSVTYNYKSPNTHKNYIEAKQNNRYVVESFFNTYLQCSGVASKNVDIGEIVDVGLPSLSSYNLQGAEEFDNVNSGKYMVGVINHTINQGGIYYMDVVLFRNGLNKTDTKEMTSD